MIGGDPFQFPPAAPNDLERHLLFCQGIFGEKNLTVCALSAGRKERIGSDLFSGFKFQGVNLRLHGYAVPRSPGGWSDSGSSQYKAVFWSYQAFPTPNRRSGSAAHKAQKQGMFPGPRGCAIHLSLPQKQLFATHPEKACRRDQIPPATNPP